jgi:hypothetical protein
MKNLVTAGQQAAQGHGDGIDFNRYGAERDPP